MSVALFHTPAMRPLHYVLYVMLGYLALVADRALMPTWSIAGVAPNVLFLLLVVATLTWRTSDGALLGGMAGLLADLTGQGTFGLGIAWGAMMGAMLEAIRGAWVVHWWPVRVAITGIALGSLVIVPATIEVLLAGEARLLLGCWLHALAIGAYTAAISVPLWLCFHWSSDPAPQTSAI